VIAEHIAREGGSRQLQQSQIESMEASGENIT
jgi:hypothetical protein